MTDLSVGFPTEDGVVHAVRGVSFDVRPGEVLGIVGESGCGKSVSALAVMGLLPRTAAVTGSIRYRGRELVGLPERDLQSVRGNDIGMIFQDPMSSLNPVYPVGWQLAEAYRAHHECPGRPPPRRPSRRWSWSASRSRTAAPGSTRTSSPAACGSGP